MKAQPATCSAFRFPLLLIATAIVLVSSAHAAKCPDADQAGYADCTVPHCSSKGLTCGDCDDANPSVHPGAEEICNHVDDDCDGESDEPWVTLDSFQRFADPQFGQDDAFGSSLAEVGDVTGDGIADVAVGVPGDWIAGVRRGSVLVLSGADGSSYCRLDDPSNLGSAPRFGASVAGLGDVDNDGVPDIAVGAHRACLGGRVFQRRSVTVFSGADCSVVYRVENDPPRANLNFGFAVAGLGDVDGDRRPDFAVGPYEDGCSEGSVSVFSASSGIRERNAETSWATPSRLRAM